MKEVRAETQEWKLEARTEAKAIQECCLLRPALPNELSGLSYTTRDVPPTVNWALPHLSFIKTTPQKLAYKPKP